LTEVVLIILIVQARFRISDGDVKTNVEHVRRPCAVQSIAHKMTHFSVGSAPSYLAVDVVVFWHHFTCQAAAAAAATAIDIQ